MLDEMDDFLRKELFYDPETGRIFWKEWKSGRSKGAIGQLSPSGYMTIAIRKKKYYSHRLAWFLYYDKWPTLQIDHINRLRTDNRIANPQEVTNQQNTIMSELSSTNTSGYRGVSWMKHDEKWISQIRVDRKLIYLGVYETAEEASRAHEEARLKYFEPILSGIQKGERE